MIFRQAREEEFLNVFEFVSHCKPLESYAEHVYKIMLRHFNNSCFVVEEEKKIVGFVLGFVSQTDMKTYFLWQVGISPDKQGKGLGGKLLDFLEKKVKGLGCKRIELTIDPQNLHSQKLFEKKDYQNISRKEADVVMVKGKAAVKDYYKPGRHFMLYEKYI